MQADLAITSLEEPLTDLTRTRFRATIRKAIALGNAVHIIDLSKLSQLDAKTLAELIRVARWLRDVGEFLHIIADRPDILKIFTLTRLDRVFRIYPSRCDVLGALNSRHQIPA